MAVQILYKRINTETDNCAKEREQLKAAQLALADYLEVCAAFLGARPRLDQQISSGRLRLVPSATTHMRVPRTTEHRWT